MIQSVDVLYFVEHKARELDVACAVRYLLESWHGRRVVIASITHGLEETLATYEPSVVALPYCTSVDDYNLERVVTRWPHARYIDLAYEQVLGKTQKSFKAPKDDFARQTVLHSAWGEFFVEYLTSYKVPSGKVVVNGNPALSLYRPPYARYYGDARMELAERFRLDPSKYWVFIPENYGWGFFTDKMVRDRIRRGFNPDDAFRYRDFARDSLAEVSRWWVDASVTDGVELIIRPRPAIPQDEFAAAVRTYAGSLPDSLRIIKYGSVREWILASDMVMSSYSTTLLDAAVASKPVYMLAPIEFPDFLHAAWYELTPQLVSYDEFTDAIKDENAKDNWKPLQGWVTSQMLSQGNGVDNLVRMLEMVLNHQIDLGGAEEIAAQLQAPSLAKAIKGIRKIGWRLFQSMLNLSGKKTHEQTWQPHEADAIDPVDIEKRLERWRRVLLDGKHA